jgi:diamine N-acetyltransferase
MTDPETVQIRIAGPADAELLAEFGARTFEDSFGYSTTPEDLAAYLSANFTPSKLADELAAESTRFLIAEIDGAEAGYVKLRWTDPPSSITANSPLELVRIYAAREWHGRGVGPALMTRALQEAQQMAADVLWLSVWQENERAIAFYEKWDFDKVGEQFFMIGTDRQADWLMARSI